MSTKLPEGEKPSLMSRFNLKQKIKDLDLLAPEVGLNFKGKSGVKTYLGVFLSIVCALTFVAGAAIIASKYFDKTQPTVLQDLLIGTEYPKIDLIAEKRFVALIFAYEGSPVPVDKINSFVTVVSNISTQETVVTDAGIIRKYTTNAKPLIPCRNLPPEILNLMPSHDQAVVKYIKTYAVCPDLNLQDYKVFGKSSDPLARRLEVKVFPCSLGPDRCVPRDKVEDLSFTFGHVEPNFNMSNYEDPISYAWDPNDFHSINVGATQNLNSEVMKTEIWNDGGLFTEQTLVGWAYSRTNQMAKFRYRSPELVQCSTLPLNEKNCPPYMIFQMTSGGKVEKLVRVYKGAVETLGEIGGIRDIIITATLAIYWIFHDKLVRNEIVSSIFDDFDQNAGPSESSDSFSKVLGRNPSMFHAAPGTVSEPVSMGSASPGRSISPPIISQSSAGQTLKVGLDYQAAMQTVEDTLDVVNLVRRLQWLETFVEFLLKQSDDNEGPDIGKVLSFTANPSSKVPASFAHNNHQNSQRSINISKPLEAGDQHDDPYSPASSEGIAKGLSREYQQYLQQVILKNRPATSNHLEKSEPKENIMRTQSPKSIFSPALMSRGRQGSTITQKLQVVSPNNYQSVSLLSQSHTAKAKPGEVSVLGRPGVY